MEDRRRSTRDRHFARSREAVPAGALSGHSIDGATGAHGRSRCRAATRDAGTEADPGRFRCRNRPRWSSPGEPGHPRCPAAGQRLGDLLRVEGQFAEHAADRVGEAGEVQARGRRPGCGRRGRPGCPGRPRTSRWPTSPSRARVYPVAAITASGATRAPSAEHDLAVLEVVYGGHDLHPAACAPRRSGPRPAPGWPPPPPGCRGRCRGAAAPGPTGRARRSGPVLRASRSTSPTGSRRTRTPVPGRASPRSSGARCAGRCADREPYPGGAALRQVHGDLRAGVADARRRGRPGRRRAGVAVPRGVQELAGVRVAAGPVRQRGACGCSRWRPRPRRRSARGRRWRAAASPAPSAACSMRDTSTPVTISSRWCSAYFSRYRTTSSRATHRPNRRGIGSPGSADRRRVVCRCSRS
ncbi:hypothetical protein SVIOM74S_04792 [Streptomyces violarus]